MEVAARAAEPDVRVFAITPASMRALESCGVADGILSSGRVSSYDRMQVWDALGPGHICFSTDDGAAVPQPLHALARSLESAATAALRGSASEPDASRLRRERRAVGASESDSGSSGRTVPAQLGYIAENGLLNGALFDELQRLDAAGRLQLLCPGKVKSIRAPPAGTTAGMLPSIRAGTGSSGPSSPSPSPAPAPSPDQLASVTLDDGRVIRARLLVAADGAMSAVRGAAGIATWGWGYDQTAVVATVRTEEAHTTAWQRFLPHGPVAVLPVSASVLARRRFDVWGMGGFRLMHFHALQRQMQDIQQQRQQQTLGSIAAFLDQRQMYTRLQCLFFTWRCAAMPLSSR